jgi:hypothetical protein
VFSIYVCNMLIFMSLLFMKYDTSEINNNAEDINASCAIYVLMLHISYKKYHRTIFYVLLNDRQTLPNSNWIIIITILILIVNKTYLHSSFFFFIIHRHFGRKETYNVLKTNSKHISMSWKQYDKH